VSAPSAEVIGRESRLYAQAADRMLERIDATAASVGDAFPLSADPATGVWQTSPDGRWTGGFWVGLLWLAQRSTGLDRYGELASAAMTRLECRLAIDNVLNGLVFYYGAALGAMLAGREDALALGKKGARALASHYQARAGFIPLGHQSGSLTADANGETNIDGVPGMSLLFWAASRTGEDSLADVGAKHVQRHIELCQRADGSLHQAALVDPVSGALLRQYSPRGIATDGSWARAQSWGMLGFAQACAWTGDRRFAEAAMAVADWWLASVPSDRVAYWDFADPAIPRTERDTSASAMAASALLKLGQLAPTAQLRKRYLDAGKATLDVLIDKYLTPTHAGDARGRGILTEGCWQRNEGVATRHELIWGSYFMYEALLAVQGRLDRVL
jgi:unsaturated chondroitin disaccharide hydrolase